MNKQHVVIFMLTLGIITALCFSQNIEILPLPESSRNQSPVLCFTADGTLWSAWSSFRNGRFRLAVCSRKTDEWDEIEYPNQAPEDQREPFWIPGNRELPRLIYSAYDGDRWTVREIQKSAAGWTDPVTIGDGASPTACRVGDAVWVAWEDKGRILYKIQSGNTWNSEPESINSDLHTGALSSPVLCSGPAGEVWLAWTCAQIDYQGVRLQRIDRPGQPALVVDEGSGVNRHPQLSMDAAGRIWIVYENLSAVKRSQRVELAENKYPVYVYDRTYQAHFPAVTVRVTDGESWWVPEKPSQPAPGLMPTVHCSSGGNVWLLSRSFTGYSSPHLYFSPLAESLNAKGWINHGPLWSTGQCYKSVLSVAEDQKGQVWTAWAQHDRKKKGFSETPSWTHMDGPDRIFIARAPELPDSGPPRLIPWEREQISIPDPHTFPRFQTTYNNESLQVYFGDLHQHSEFSGCGRRNGAIDQNQRYSRWVRGLDFMSTIDHGEHLNDHTWRWTQLAAEKNHLPGKFVTFTGFEWTSEFDGGGNLYRGHYNAIFRTVGSGDDFFSASDPATNTPLELWTALRKSAGGPQNVLTFAHHTSRRMAWLTWNYYDPEMAPLIEIAQARGSYEYEGCYLGPELDNDCTRVSGHYIQDGLDRGMRFGFVASGDHGGRQLVAVYAPELTRSQIFQALKAKRVYATSGERILLDVRLNGHFMGEEFEFDGISRKLHILCTGTAPVVEVDIFRNGRSIKQWAMNRDSVELDWEDIEPLWQRESYYYVRIIQADGAQAWSSPIWVINPDLPGRFRFQIGGDELRVIYPDQEADFAILMHNETSQPIRGTVSLDVPESWTLARKNTAEVECPPGGWKTVVFNVSVPQESLKSIALPSVTARFQNRSGEIQESALFVVASPRPLSREQKAVLVDARTQVPTSQFAEYLKQLTQIWKKRK